MAALEKPLRWVRILLDGRPPTSDSPPPRNPIAVIGFVLSLFWLATSPVPMIDVLGVWTSRSDAALDLIVTASISAGFVTPVVLWLGLRRADRNQRPHQRLAIAGILVWVGGWFVSLNAFVIALRHGLS